MDEEQTTIRITKKLSEKLSDFGRKGETYEEIIWKLIALKEGGKKK